MTFPINSRLDVNMSATSNSIRYPENLSKIADSADERSTSYGKYTNQQILEASEKLNQREQAAFGYLSHDASTAGIIQFAKAYISYINSLSPEEQNGVRYKGTKQSMSELLNQANAQLGNEKFKSPSEVGEYKSLLTMLFDEMEKTFYKHGISQELSRGEKRSTEIVTISNSARTLNRQP